MKYITNTLTITKFIQYTLPYRMITLFILTSWQFDLMYITLTKPNPTQWTIPMSTIIHLLNTSLTKCMWTCLQYHCPLITWTITHYLTLILLNLPLQHTNLWFLFYRIIFHTFRFTFLFLLVQLLYWFFLLFTLRLFQ